jgi:hypothetical protein
MLTTQQLVILAVTLLVLVVVVAIAGSRNSQRRRAMLRRRFGPEYDRAVEHYGNVPKAERVLAARANRIGRFHLRDLNEADRFRFSSSWRMIQTRFVDDPPGAVHEANDLIKTVMLARGYPVEDFEQRVADLSVDHANVVQNYRAARVLAEANREGRANTEELRQAFVHYRALFADLLDEPAVAATGMHEARA